MQWTCSARTSRSISANQLSMGPIAIGQSHKKTFKEYRDGIPKKQPNKVGMIDTTVPLRTPIPISLDIFPKTYRMESPKSNQTR